MTDASLTPVPREARPYQGAAAGVATRLAAALIDVVVIGVAMLAGYAGYIGLRLLIDPRGYRLPDTSLAGAMTAFLVVLVAYLTLLWWMTGRTYGDHVMGITVVSAQRSRIGLLRAGVRALLYALFPLGLLWCAVSAERRSLQDVVLRTHVVYDWLPHHVDV